MKKRLSVLLSILFAVIIGFSTYSVATEPSTPPCEIEVSQPKQEVKQVKQEPVVPLTNLVNPVNVVKNTNGYMNKRINVSAKFNKFSTLGLDYKPAMRSSENYISFLIFRPDTANNIPLSEMKLFVKRSMAEKYIELKEGDCIQFSGVVFSNALGDTWVDVDKLDKLNK